MALNIVTTVRKGCKWQTVIKSIGIFHNLRRNTEIFKGGGGEGQGYLFSRKSVINLQHVSDVAYDLLVTSNKKGCYPSDRQRFSYLTVSRKIAQD